MQYFGDLRRDPDKAGFNFWLNKLNQFNGDFVKAPRWSRPSSLPASIGNASVSNE
jgi:hypothetical protein